MDKKQEVMNYLQEKIFDPALNSPNSTKRVKKGVNYTIMRMNNLDAKGVVMYFWSAVAGTQKSINFSSILKTAGITRFEDIFEDFRERFNDEWLRRKDA